MPQVYISDPQKFSEKFRDLTQARSPNHWAGQCDQVVRKSGRTRFGGCATGFSSEFMETNGS